MMQRTSNLRVESIRPLLSPAILLEELPLTEAAAETVNRGREQVSNVLHGRDDRLLAVVGPCSIHDPLAAIDYGGKLLALSRDVSGDLLVVMRVYFEKPRTTLGWKGLINDPHLDGSFQINHGLRLARRTLLKLSEMGLPAGSEFLDPITPQYLSDLVTWGTIGARTTESQVHRELASGLSMPIGFKNGTNGDVQVAIDAVRSAAEPHRFLGVTEQGLCGIVSTRGNGDCHVILRGGREEPNFGAEAVRSAVGGLASSGLVPRLMIDTSHGNSRKDHRNQPGVAHDVARQIAGGECGVFGVMMESFLVEGSQKVADPARLTYGQSITDGCMGWETTVPILHELAAAVRERRKTLA